MDQGFYTSDGLIVSVCALIKSHYQTLPSILIYGQSIIRQGCFSSVRASNGATFCSRKSGREERGGDLQF